MMIRFLPDTWADALLRPLAMAAADAGVYVETRAPDWRFAAAVLLGAIVLFSLRGWKQRFPPVALLALWLVVAFVVWLTTSGNGRYFMPGLLIVGPLCIGLAARLPGTRDLRLAVAVGLVAVQGWVVVVADPWGSWGLGTWDKAPFFPVALDEEAVREPATYVTMTGISYSLIAPMFHPESRWVNISSLPDASQPSPDGQRIAALLRESSRIRLVVPSRPDHMTPEGQPSSELLAVMNAMLSAQRLRMAEPPRCRLLPSRGLATVGAKVDKLPPDVLEKMGFWVCDLQYPAPAPEPQKLPGAGVSRVFELVEHQCPRFYKPGQTSASRVEGGWLRAYPDSDLRVYVMDDGNVYYKYWRALNPELLGHVPDILAGGEVPCTSVQGRTGLPWDREI
jgi:hypothetical protein